MSDRIRLRRARQTWQAIRAWLNARREALDPEQLGPMLATVERLQPVLEALGVGGPGVDRALAIADVAGELATTPEVAAFLAAEDLTAEEWEGLLYEVLVDRGGIEQLAARLAALPAS